MHLACGRIGIRETPRQCGIVVMYEMRASVNPAVRFFCWLDVRVVLLRRMLLLVALFSLGYSSLCSLPSKVLLQMGLGLLGLALLGCPETGYTYLTWIIWSLLLWVCHFQFKYHLYLTSCIMTCNLCKVYYQRQPHFLVGGCLCHLHLLLLL